MTNPIVEFHDQEGGAGHGQFQAWRRKNPNGLILNQKSRRQYLRHASNCPHLGSPHVGTKSVSAQGNARRHDLTASRKLCASIPELLFAWAAQSNVNVQVCQNCQPATVTEHCLAYHNVDAWDEYKPERRGFRHYSGFPKSRLEKNLGRVVWVIVGETVYRRKQYTLGGFFRPSKLEAVGNGFALVGKGTNLANIGFDWIDSTGSLCYAKDWGTESTHYATSRRFKAWHGRR